MEQKCEQWKKRVQSLPEGKAAFEKWLFVHIAGVLVGGKPGELMILKAGKCGLSLGDQIDSAKGLSRLWGVRLFLLTQGQTRVRVVFYDANTLQPTLYRLPQWVMERIGYPFKPAPADFFREIARRWNHSNQIPHEIAFALGYPVKDVLGYMGLVPLPYTGKCGWKIHGDTGPSMQLSRQFKKAREWAEAFIYIG
jgi:hypothetical protein